MVCLCFFTYTLTTCSYRMLLSEHFSMTASWQGAFLEIQRHSHIVTLDKLKCLVTIKLNSLSMDYFSFTNKLSKSKSIISHLTINFQGICKTSR